MALLDGILKFSFGVSYKVEEGILDIKKGIRSSRKVIINNIPVSFFQELLPLLKGKNVNVTLKDDDESIVDDISDVTYHNTDLHAKHGSEKMHFGCIILPKILFDIVWNEEGIKNISGVQLHSCLKCDVRTNLCKCTEQPGEEVCFGGIFDSEEGVGLIKDDLKKYSKAIITYLPDFLIEELIPFFKGKEIRIMMPYGHKIHAELKEAPHSRIASKLIKPNIKVYGQQDAMGGGICFPNIHYGVAWKDDKILEIRTTEVEDCVHCMVERHITAWSFGKRIP